MFGAVRNRRKRKHNDELIELNQSAKLCIESKPPLKITDLNDECLNRILNLLHLYALSCVAQANIQLNELVFNILKRKCDGAKVSIFSSEHAQWLWIDGTSGKFIFKDVSDLRKCFQRIGDLITNLSIGCSPHTQYYTYQKVERSIFEYCFEMLIKIKIESNQLPVLSEVTKVFCNVEELHLNGCELSVNLSQQFSTLFPSMRRLTLINCKVRNPKCIETNFSCLEELIVIGKRKNRMVFKKENVKEALRLNPQIRQLLVDFNSTNDREANNNHPDYELNADFYRFVSETLPKLEEYAVYGERNYQDEIIVQDEIEFWYLKKFTLHYIYSRQPNEIAPFKFNRLQELKLEQMTNLSDEWVQFIILNVGLKKLTIDINYDSSHDKNEEDDSNSQIKKEQLMTIVKWLPKLKELHLPAGAVDSKDIMAILTKRKSLKKIYLRDYDVIESIVDTFDNLTAKKKWTVDYDAQNLILKRFN